MIPGITDCQFWTPSDYRDIERADCFEAIGEKAVEVLRRMPQPVSQLCGPISTGGLNCVHRNLVLFKRCVEELRIQGLNPFDQIPLQIGFMRLAKLWHMENGEGYCLPILHVVYRRIFESLRVARTFFLPYWWKSYGTTWEGQTVTRLSIPCHGFPRHWYRRILYELREQVA
jgi:hypothetical protein